MMSGIENPKGKRAANNALWEKHKSLLERLYLTDGMSLKSTMEFMTMNHGFNMSKAQYETMFKKWKFKKNISAKEWSTLNGCIEDRESHGKDSTITIGTLQVNPKRIGRARARYSVQTSQEVVLRDIDYPSNVYSQCVAVRTPPPPELNVWHRLPASLPWFCFLSTYNDKPMHFSAIVLNTGRDIIQSMNFWYRGNSFPISTIHRKMQQEIFGWLRPHLLSKPDGYPTINLEQAFGLTTKIPHLEFIKLAIYILSNNILVGRDEESIGMKMIELCHSVGMLQFLKRLLADKQCTIRAMAEKLLFFAVHANDKMVTQILLEAGASPMALFGRFSDDTFSVAMKLNRTELLPLLICAGAREDCPMAQLAFEEVEEIPFKWLLKLSLETNQPHFAMRLLRNYHPRGSYDVSLLRYALENCDAEIVELVLNYEAGRIWRKGSQRTPELTCFEFASSTGDMQKFQLVLQNIERIKNAGCGGFRKCLPYAARSGNRQLVEELLSQGAQIDDTTSSGMSCLQVVDMNDLPMVQYLLDCGANPNSTAMGCGTPLHYAARSGNLAAVKLLFDHGAKLGAISGSLCSQDSLVRDAIRSGNVAVVEEILKVGAVADVWINEPYATPLQLASYQGSIDIVRLLLSHNANINSPPGRAHMISWTTSVTALTGALHSRDIQLILYLLDHGADVNNPPAEDEAPSPLRTCILFLDYNMTAQLLRRGANPEDSGAIWMAVRKADLRIVNLLLDQNRKLLSQNRLSQGAGFTDYGCAALCEAVLTGKYELVCTLLEAGVDFKRLPTRIFKQAIIKARGVNYFGSPSTSAILAAIKTMNLNLLQMFLSQGSHNLRENLHGNSELLLAMHSIPCKHKDVLQILKLINPTVHEVNSYFSYPYDQTLTILQKAIRNGCCLSVVNYLLSIGADINSPAVGKFGRTALQAAVERKRDDIVEILIHKGASINADPAVKYGATAFQFAAMNGNFKIVQLLLDAGADVLAPKGKRYGRTAIEGAAERGHLDMVLYLLHLANVVEGVDFEHQLCRASRLALKRGHIALSEVISEHQKDKFGRLHCEGIERLGTCFDYDTFAELDRESEYSEDENEWSETDVPITSSANPSLPIRGLNINGMPEVEEKGPSTNHDSQNIHNIPTYSNCLEILAEEAMQYETTEIHQIAAENDSSLTDSTITLNQERKNDLMLGSDPVPTDYLADFHDIPGSMATPQWDESEVIEKCQTATDNDPNLSDSTKTSNQERENNPDTTIVDISPLPNDYLPDFVDIPRSMFTPQWNEFDLFEDLNMSEQATRERLLLG